jgi:hypothetical protein
MTLSTADISIQLLMDTTAAPQSRRAWAEPLEGKLRWSGFPGQPLSLTSKAGYRP